MTREQFETAVREQLARVTANALMSGVTSTAILQRATDIILDAADSYRATPQAVE